MRMTNERRPDCYVIDDIGD